jgi:hypothetical protein
MRMPVIPGELLETALAPGSRDPGQTLGQHLVRTVVTVWDMPEIRATVLGLLRTAVTSEQAAAMLREFLSAAMLGRIAGAAADPGTPDARRRAALVASQMVGLALARYVLAIEPIASSRATSWPPPSAPPWTVTSPASWADGAHGRAVSPDREAVEPSRVTVPLDSPTTGWTK